MVTIRIDKDVNLDDLEASYTGLYNFIDKDFTIHLLLPKSIENKYLGMIPALFQFSNTWARYPKSGKLLIDIDNPETEDLSELYDNELLFPIISFVWNQNGVYNNTGKINLRTYLKDQNAEVFAKMLKVQPLKGKKRLVLTSFDHLPKDKGLLPCFETGQNFVKNESILRRNLDEGVSDVINFSYLVKENYNDIKSELLGIIFELMKNTYEWARTDSSKVPLNPNIRGLLLRFVKKKRRSLIEECKDQIGLKTYFESKKLSENNQNELYFMEVSVFDSGIGFVEKFKSLNDSTDLNDIEIVKKCLILHNTSAKGLDRDDKGLGLDRILNILDKKGFLRIKTGKVDVYRNLISHPYEKLQKEEVNKMDLYDWKTNSNSIFSSNPEASGSVVTIIYPLLMESK